MTCRIVALPVSRLTLSLVVQLQALPAEPDAAEADVVQVAVRMPSGTRFTRRYRSLHVTAPEGTTMFQCLCVWSCLRPYRPYIVIYSTRACRLHIYTIAYIITCTNIYRLGAREGMLYKLSSVTACCNTQMYMSYMFVTKHLSA